MPISFFIFIFLTYYCKQRLLFWELLTYSRTYFKPGFQNLCVATRADSLKGQPLTGQSFLRQQATVFPSSCNKKPRGTNSYLGHRKMTEFDSSTHHICHALQSSYSLSFTLERWRMLEGRAPLWGLLLSVWEGSLFSQPSRDQAAPWHSLLKSEDLEFR